MQCPLEIGSAERTGWGMGGWVHPKGADSTTVSGLHFGWLWVGHCCPPMHKEVEKLVLCMVTISEREAFSQSGRAVVG